MKSLSVLLIAMVFLLLAQRKSGLKIYGVLTSLLMIIALGSIFFPDQTNSVADFLKDQSRLAYILVVTNFALIILWIDSIRNQQDLSRKLTDLVRQRAIIEAKEPSDSKANENPARTD